MEKEKINKKLEKLEKKVGQLMKTLRKASKMTSQKQEKLQSEVCTLLLQPK
jgi:Skp family chaperone for outer membrane proteins